MKNPIDQISKRKISLPIDVTIETAITIENFNLDNHHHHLEFSYLISPDLDHLIEEKKNVSCVIKKVADLPTIQIKRKMRL